MFNRKILKKLRVFDIKVESGFETFQCQILDEGYYADPDSQATCNEHILSLWCTTALSAWDKIQESGKQIESYAKIIQGPREPFSDFLQRLIKTVQIEVADPETRWVLISGSWKYWFGMQKDTWALKSQNSTSGQINPSCSQIWVLWLQQWGSYMRHNFQRHEETSKSQMFQLQENRPFEEGIVVGISRNKVPSGNDPYRRFQLSGLCRR